MAWRTAAPGEVNHNPVDRWTLGHVAIGAGMGIVGLPFWSAAAVGIGWEVLERPARVRSKLFEIAPGSYSGQDTIVNSICDALANMAGWWLGAQVRRKR